ncbi:hypothetical protein BKA93DRAFT_620454 [Sparassis latifolia]|uniref:F-box domain-containing protein n=1 Tax=Sparassis crispa TaxID=139825 RepID=A0A401H4W5_9APHY|nr:hypothetical protein SCP_1601470 [Sparassis crispa]GBE89485.1 hypothetical protein SCP_1601470 [Sparassis crispa]
MPLISLNDDVLEYIISFVSPSDALRLAKTCRRAYAAAIPQSHSHIAITTPQKLARFCNFMLADSPRRPSCLEAITLRDSAFRFSTAGQMCPDYSSTSQLSEVLRHASALQSLTLYHLEKVLEIEPSLKDVLAALTRLKNVSFFQSGSQSFDLLSRLASRPRYLEIGGKGRVLQRAPAGLLAPLATSLGILKLWSSATLLDTVDRNCRFFRVHTLVINEQRSLSRLAHLFPNVRSLHLLHIGPTSVTWDGLPQWNLLDHVEIYTAAPFSGHVRRLEIEFGSSLSPVLDDVYRMLRNTSPVVLCVGLEPTLFLQLPELAPHLKYLQLTDIEAVGAEPEVYVERSLQNIAQGLSALPLVGLLLRYATHWEGNRCIGADSLLQLAQEVAARISTLEYVGFDGRNTYMQQTLPLAYSWFCVGSRADGSPSMELLSQREGCKTEEHLLALDSAQ